MPFRYEIDAERQLILWHFALEEFTIAEWIKCTSILSGLPPHVRLYNEITDLRGSAITLSQEEIDAAIRFEEGFILTLIPDAAGQKRAAWITDDPVKLSFDNLTAALNEVHGGPVFKRFSDPTDAYSWLGFPDLVFPQG